MTIGQCTSGWAKGGLQTTQYSITALSLTFFFGGPLAWFGEESRLGGPVRAGPSAGIETLGRGLGNSLAAEGLLLGTPLALAWPLGRTVPVPLTATRAWGRTGGSLGAAIGAAVCKPERTAVGWGSGRWAGFRSTG